LRTMKGTTSASWWAVAYSSVIIVPGITMAVKRPANRSKRVGSPPAQC
jgi:hypothetical protein